MAASPQSPDKVEPKKADPKQAPKKELKVAEGKSITSLRGIITEGSGPVSANDFSGGAVAVKKLVELGYLV